MGAESKFGCNIRRSQVNFSAYTSIAVILLQDKKRMIIIIETVPRKTKYCFIFSTLIFYILKEFKTSQRYVEFLVNFPFSCEIADVAYCCYYFLLSSHGSRDLFTQHNIIYNQ